MAKPNWSEMVASPSSFGTPEAADTRKQQQVARNQGTDQPDWSRFVAEPSTDPGGGAQGVSWATLTGQNLQQPTNAFDTTFWQTATKQDQEQADRGMDTRWTRDDATGVAVYDDAANDVQFGDVFLNGEKQGNLREGYAGVSADQGNEMLARMVLPREVWAKAYESEAGKPLTFSRGLDEELEAARRKNTEDYEKGLSAQGFESDVSERAADLEDSGAAQVGNVAAGASGGAATGAGLGATIGAAFGGVGAAPGAAVGAIVGAIGGGLGAWFNRDEQFRQLATAQEQYERATADGHQAVGFADAFSGYGAYAASQLGPVRNLYHGAVDAVQGTQGDQEVAYRDEQQGLGSQALDTAAMLADGVGSFGGATARKLFTLTMGATATGQAASVAAGAADGNVAFNPYAGRYEDIGVTGMAQQAAAAGIDIGQTFLGAAAGKAIDRGADAAGGFRIGTNAAGERTTRGLSITSLIPSEAATGLSARLFARRSLRNQGVEATRENVARETARYIDNLTSGRKTIATAMVNGFGEGAEEAVQAVLGATAFGETPTFREVFDAARQGFGMGAGLGTAIGVHSTSLSARYKERSDSLRALRGEEAIPTQVWDKMTDSDRAAEGTPRSEDEARLVEAAVKSMRRDGSAAAVRSIPEVQRANDVARQAVLREAANSQVGVEPSRLQTMSNYEWEPQDYVVSLPAATRDVRARQAVLSRAAAGEPVIGENGTTLSLTEQERQQAAQLAQADERMLGMLTAAQEQIDAGAEVDEVVGRVNTLLQQAWYSKPDQGPEAYGARRSASVLAARYPLNSAGSFQLLRLQISPRLTREGNTMTALVSDRTIVPQGGDYDGDRNSNLIRALLPDDSYEMMRRGAGQLTTTGTAIEAQPFVAGMSDEVYAALNRPGTTDHRAAVQFQKRLTARLNAILRPSSIPVPDRRRLVSAAVRQLSDRDPSALADLTNRLASEFSGPMRQLAVDIDESPFLRIERAMTDELRQFATELALRVHVPPSVDVEFPVVSHAMPRYESRPVEQSSDLLTAAAAARSTDVFRVQTILKYNARREATETQPQEREGLLNELIQTFTALNDGIALPGRDMLDDGVAAQRGTIAYLRSLARQSQAELGTRTANEALVLLAGARVPDLGPDVRAPGAGADVLLVQAALHEVIVQMRRRYAQVLAGNETLAMQLSSLDALTTPNVTEADGARHAQGGNAFVEVLGSMPIDELLGDQGAAIASYTVRGLRDYLITLRSAGLPGGGDTRQEFEGALKSHPSYALGDDGRPSPYRVLVDQVMESAHQQLHEVDGIAKGALAASSNVATRNFGDMHDSLRKLARSRGLDTSSPASMRTMLSEDRPLASRVLRIMEERGLGAAIRRTEQGGVSRIEFPQWIYRVLAEPSTKRAEMILLRETLRSAYAALGQTGRKLDEFKVSDRVLRLWLHLDYAANDLTSPTMLFDRAARDRFLEVFEDEQGTVEDFMRALNTDFRFRSETTPPYIPWARDRAVTDPSRHGRGVSEVLEGTEMRDALRDAAAAAGASLRQSETTREFLDRKDNRELISQLREARDNPRSVNRPVWDRFVQWVDFARDLPTMVGASLWIQQAGHINEVLSNMGVKGVAPENVAQLGQAIAAQMPVFDSAVGRMTASLTSGSLDDVLTDAATLQRERTLVLPDGTVVDWAGLTPESALDLLANERTAGVAARALGMTAWDYNADTQQNMLAAVTGTGVAGLVGDPATVLFGAGQSTKLRRLMILEAAATVPGGEPIIPVFLAEQMNVREAAVGHVIEPGSPERTRMALDILEDLADALQDLSTIDGMYVRDGSRTYTRVPDDGEGGTGVDVTLINRALLRAARQARRAHGGANLFSRSLPENEDLRDAAYAMLQGWIAKYAERAVVEDNALAKIMARRLKRDLETVDEIASPLDEVIAAYQDYTDPTVQALLMTHLRSVGEISRTVPWARDAISRALDPRTATTVVPLAPGAMVPLPDLTTEQWDLIARGIVAHTMHTKFGIATTSDMELPVFPSLGDQDALDARRAYWDPTFVELGVNMFAPGLARNPNTMVSRLLQAQLDLVQSMGQTLEPSTSDRAERAVAKFILPKRTDPDTGVTSGTTGRWHGLIPALMHSATGAVMSSATESATQMAGINPDRLAYLAATTKQDWTRRPGDDELSTMSISASELTAAVVDGTELDELATVTFPGGGRVTERPLAQLDGRVVRQLELSIPDRDPISLLGHPRFGSGLLLPDGTGIPATEGGVVSLSLLGPSVSAALNDAGVPTSLWPQVRVEASLFHPETKAVSALRGEGQAYEHSPWFDGVNGRTEAAYSQQSLLGSLHFSLDGEVPKSYDRSLAAIKKLTFALQQVTTMPEALRRPIVDNGLSDMAGMLRQLTDFALRQQIDGKPLGAAKYNAMHKLLSLMYVVRHVEDGRPQVLSAEQVMARQMSNQPLGEHAEVVGLPLQFVLALMGERGAAVPAVTAYNDTMFTVDVSRATQYEDFPAEAWTDSMFGGLIRTQQDDSGQVTGWATRDLLAEASLQNMSMPKPRVWGDLSSQPTTGRDFFSGFRAHQAEVQEQRARTGDRRWSEQKASVHQRLLTNPNIGQQSMQAVQLAATGDFIGAALRTAPATIPGNAYDLSTAWEYRHYGAKGKTGIEGQLNSAELDRVAFGDEVFVPADTFFTATGTQTVDDVWPDAREVLGRLMGFGATIVLPSVTVGAELRSRMVRYLAERGYAAKEENTEAFEPVPMAGATRAEIAFRSSLRGAVHRTSQNRVPVSLSLYNQVNENSIMSVNGGLGAREDYFVREVVQTARYAGYAPPNSRARKQLVRLLLPLLSKPDGREYLRRVSGFDELPDGTDEERTAAADALVDFDRALDDLATRLTAARNDPSLSLLPAAGDEFGTGDIVPLVSYNPAGELLGVHLHRHGHEPVDEQLIAGGDYPPGNEALGFDGARLTIDSARVDAGHTTHRGSTVGNPEWLGLQGFTTQMRVRLADLGSKVFESLTGMKWTTTEAPSDLPMPQHDLFAGLPVLGAGDIASPTAKDSDGWWLNTPSQIVEVVGFDTMPYLVRALTGVQYSAATAGEYGAAEETVRDTLRRFAAVSANSIEPHAAVTRDTDEFRTQLAVSMQRQLTEIMGDAAPAINDQDSERSADLGMLELVLTSLAAGARLSEVTGAPGYLTGATQSHTMHPVFTSLLHQLPVNHPTKRAFVQQVNSRMSRYATGGNGVDRWQLDPGLTSWTRIVQTPSGVQQIPDMLAFPEIRNTGHNDALSDQALTRKQKASSSETANAMLYVAWDTTSLIEEPFTADRQVFASNQYLHTEAGRKALSFNRGTTNDPHAVSMSDDLKMNPAEYRHIFVEALPAANALAVPIDTSRWYEGQNKATRRNSERTYEENFRLTLRALRLGQEHAPLLDEMIRSVVARPAPPQGSDQPEYLTYREAMAAMKLIRKNAADGLLPTHGGAVSTMSRRALAALREHDYPLRTGRRRSLVGAGWDEWVSALVAETFSADPMLRGYPAVSNMIDGLLHAYRKDIKGLPATVNNQLAPTLKLMQTRNGVLMASPVQRRRADVPTIEQGEPVYDLRDLEAADWMLEDLPQSARDIVEQRMASWEKRNGLAGRRRQSPRAEALRGAHSREEFARTNVLMRFAQLGVLLKTLVNPGLWVSAFIELGVRGAQERVTSLLSGESARTQGFTSAQRQQWRDAVDSLADNPEFYRSVYENTNYQQAGATSGVERRLEKFTNFASAMYNDPTWGTRATTMSNRFIEAAWDAVSKMPLEQNVSLEQFLDILSSPDPVAGLEQISRDAVNYGYRRIEYARGLQDNLMARTVRRTTEGIIGSGGPATNTLGVLLLRFPTLFFRFRSNTIINMMGLQAPHAVISALMSDRTKRAGGLKDQLTGAAAGMDRGITDQAALEDSMDLTRAIIRSGVSHTQLFILGSMISSAGLSGGEDDEERLLNKLRRYQSTPVAKDPLSLENDFRNAEAWFSDLLPAGMGVPTWVLKMFVTPAMGVARFHETGDFRQVLWGFMDALGSMPLLNVDTVLNSWDMATELAAAAETAAAEDDDAATLNAQKYMVTTLGVLEAMLFESSFASMIYQASDEWDRDPYAIPLRDSSGVIQREGVFNTPRPTDALTSFEDPVTGEIRQGYAGRQDIDALLHSLAENRPVLAHVLSLVMNDSTFLRQNMVPKMREVEGEAVTQDEAETILMSVLNNETGGEELTQEGATAVIRGVHLGAVGLDSPSLKGIFIPTDMRSRIQDDFLAELTDKYTSAGYSKSDALSNAKRDFYGQGYGEPEALGLADILWGDYIPTYQNQQYMQLNTTYVMGPNNRPIATGLQRSVLSSIGLNVAETYHDGTTGNLPVDQLLNSVDSARGINLGMRGLVRVDETWNTPTAEEIGQGIEDSLDRISEQLDDITDSTGYTPWSYGNGWRNYGNGWRNYGGYSSGGYSRSYGGRSYVESWGGAEQYLRTPRRIDTPYSDDLYSINTSNPIIRRATIRRERFASQRGRLNQWQ